MESFIVLYRENYMNPLEDPFAFACKADNVEHAEEQCENAYPSASIVWVFEGDDASAAISAYWESE